ncbi:MAG TPA: hypothetical protein VFO65_03070 [Acidimicrobiales bacterium]|nr:hypothetical protein [Acidimicrobiales bacterium]
MGWGWEPHEGYAARRLADGSLTATWTADTADFEAYVAVCACGWQGGTYSPTEEGSEAAGDEWHHAHWRPLVTPAAERRLILGCDGGGRRHFLDGEAVHCGTPLELLVAGGAWVGVRYESAAGEAVAYLGLGGPGEAFGATDCVHFRLPADAVLRWPEAS